MIAALYVAEGGCYFDLPNVDPWDEARDARTYAGPHPVVAHPPCARWGRYWYGGPSVRVRKAKGDDGGCFAAALAAVRRFGGVLEHPANTHAWPAFGLVEPSARGWCRGNGDTHVEWTCSVEQGHYGHRARKHTWLFAVLPMGVAPPSLMWGPSAPVLGAVRVDGIGFQTAAKCRAWREQRARGERTKHDNLERMGRRERLATPTPFRDLLLSIARSARP